MSEPIGNTKQLAEPVAVRYDFDGHGYLYMDAGSGSDWESRVKNCEFLYTHPKKELSDEEINEAKIEAVQEYYKVFPKVVIYTPIFFDELFAKAILKKASEK
jgi:hypothetical protein